MTFVDVDGRILGLTCQHVVDSLRGRLAEDPARDMVFATAVKGNYLVLDRFTNLAEGVLSLGSQLPDVAVRDIHPEFARAIGKEPIELREFLDGEWPQIESGVAIGFPTREKRIIGDEKGKRLAMQSVYAVAEPGTFDHSADVVRFRSELPDVPNVASLSGMSGGPVFAMGGQDTRFLGVVFEARPTHPNDFDPNPNVTFASQVVTRERLRDWCAHHPRPGNWLP